MSMIMGCEQFHEREHECEHEYAQDCELVPEHQSCVLVVRAAARRGCWAGGCCFHPLGLSLCVCACVSFGLKSTSISMEI